jgi:hypothetical protein
MTVVNTIVVAIAETCGTFASWYRDVATNIAVRLIISLIHGFAAVRLCNPLAMLVTLQRCWCWSVSCVLV